jgi:hypothetical protein
MQHVAAVAKSICDNSRRIALPVVLDLKLVFDCLATSLEWRLRKMREQLPQALVR